MSPYQGVDWVCVPLSGGDETGTYQGENWVGVPLSWEIEGTTYQGKIEEYTLSVRDREVLIDFLLFNKLYCNMAIK